MQSTGSDTTATTQFIFIGTMFDETMQLLVDAQNYFSHKGTLDQQKITGVERLVYSSEMSRITLRLSSVMAWLLSRRAEFAGEISREEAVQQFRLAFNDVCTQELPEMHHVLPKYMCTLMQRSLDLYRRALRLDTLISEDTLH